MGSGAIRNDVVSFQVSLQRKGLTPWILHTSHVDIAGAITWFAMVSLQMANKNIFAMRVANKVAQITAVTRILLREATKSYACMKNAVVCAVLNAPVIGVQRHAANYGVLFPNHSELEPVIVISGRHMPQLFQNRNMKQLAKKQAKQRM